MGCADGIFKNIVSNCTTAKTAGLEATAYIFNRGDASFTFSNTQNKENTITAITMATGKKAYKVQAFKKGINAGHSVVLADTRPDMYQQWVTFEAFEVLAEDTNNITALNDVVIVVEIKHKTTTGEGVFIAYGVKGGLWKAEDTLDWNADAGSRKVKLQSLGGNEEPYPYWIVFSTDYATTKAMLEGLLA